MQSRLFKAITMSNQLGVLYFYLQKTYIEINVHVDRLYCVNCHAFTTAHSGFMFVSIHKTAWYETFLTFHEYFTVTVDEHGVKLVWLHIPGNGIYSTSGVQESQFCSSMFWVHPAIFSMPLTNSTAYPVQSYTFKPSFWIPSPEDNHPLSKTVWGKGWNTCKFIISSWLACLSMCMTKRQCTKFREIETKATKRQPCSASNFLEL